MKMASRTRYDVDVFINLYSGTKKGLTAFAKDAKRTVTEFRKTFQELSKAQKQLAPDSDAFKRLYTDAIVKFAKIKPLYKELYGGLKFRRELDFLRHYKKYLDFEDSRRKLIRFRTEQNKLLAKYQDQVLAFQKSKYALIDLSTQLNELRARYKDNILYAEKFNLITKRARVTFYRWFGVLLSGMFVFNDISNALFGFIRQSINSYMVMASYSDSAYQSIMQLRGGFEDLRYSFVQVLTSTGIFETLANILRSLVSWFENLTPSQQKAIVKLTVFGAVASWVITKLSQLGILILAVSAALGSKGLAGAVEGLGAKVGAVIASIAGLPAWAIALIIASLTGLIVNWKETWNDLKEYSKNMFNTLKDFIGNWFKDLLVMNEGFLDILHGDFVSGLKKISAAIIHFIVSAFEFACNSALNIVRTQVNLMIDMLNGLFKTIDWVAKKIGMSFNFRIRWKMPEVKINVTEKVEEWLDRVMGTHYTTPKEVVVTQPTQSSVVNQTTINNTFDFSIISQSQNDFNDLVTRISEEISEQMNESLSVRGFGY